MVYQGANLLASLGHALSQRNLTTPYVIGTQGSFNSEYWFGDLAEILVYNRALSNTEFSQNVAYLQTKYFEAVGGLALTFDVLTGGVSGAGTVTLTFAPASPVTVTLTSSDPSVASVPASITVPAGSTSATFPDADGTALTLTRVVGTSPNSTGTVTLRAAVPKGLMGLMLGTGRCCCCGENATDMRNNYGFGRAVKTARHGLMKQLLLRVA
jgi:hypothetical protein